MAPKGRLRIAALVAIPSIIVIGFFAIFFAHQDGVRSPGDTLGDCSNRTFLCGFQLGRHAGHRGEWIFFELFRPDRSAAIFFQTYEPATTILSDPRHDQMGADLQRFFAERLPDLVSDRKVEFFGNADLFQVDGVGSINVQSCVPSFERTPYRRSVRYPDSGDVSSCMAFSRAFDVASVAQPFTRLGAGDFERIDFDDDPFMAATNQRSSGLLENMLRLDSLKSDVGNALKLSRDWVHSSRNHPSVQAELNDKRTMYETKMAQLRNVVIFVSQCVSPSCGEPTGT